MTGPTATPRRHVVLRVLAAAPALAAGMLIGGRSGAAPESTLLEWQGAALGGAARILLAHTHREVAQRAGAGALPDDQDRA